MKSKLMEALEHLRASVEDFENDVERAWDHEERPDLWEHVVELPIAHAKAILSDLLPLLNRAKEEGAREMQDRQRLDWLEKHPQMEVAMSWDLSDEGAWQVHAVLGNRNDREWHLRGSGSTVREAIDAARALPAPQNMGGEQ